MPTVTFTNHLPLIILVYHEEMMKTFNQYVYGIVAKIPYGHVMSYGQIARLIGNPRTSRAVGYAMNAAPHELPCHRVVFKNGALSSAFIQSGKHMQYELLRAEGVTFTKNKCVKMDKHTWHPDIFDLLFED